MAAIRRSRSCPSRPPSRWPRHPTTVADYGSGWGELLLRILVAVLRAKLNEHLSIWLRGTHGVLGFAYLTLGVSV